jgi:hypothetical protein
VSASLIANRSYLSSEDVWLELGVIDQARNLSLIQQLSDLAKRLTRNHHRLSPIKQSSLKGMNLPTVPLSCAGMLNVI